MDLRLKFNQIQAHQLRVNSQHVANIRSFFVNIARYLLPEGFKWLILPEGFSPKVILVSWSLKVTNSGDMDV